MPENRIERLCVEKGMKMTEQRRIIARVLSSADDHPDVEEVYKRAIQLDPKISIATIYRTVRLFEEANILERHDFGDGPIRTLKQTNTCMTGYVKSSSKIDGYHGLNHS